MSTLTTFTTALGQDLQDTTNATWTTALLQRAIGKAVNEFELAWPVVASATVAGVTSQLRYDESAVAGLLWVEAVEYLVDQTPKQFLAFEEETKGLIYIPGSVTPITGNNLKVWYAKVHTVDGSGSTIPLEYEELMLGGAYAHALLMRASNTINTINPSMRTPKQALDLAKERLHEYRTALERLKNERAAPRWVAQWGDVQQKWKNL